MLPDKALASMKVMLATPCYGAAVSMNYVTSIFSLTYECGRLGLDCMLHMHAESLITRSRNRIVAKFLQETDYTHLLWIDADIAFRPVDAFRLLLADRDVAVGLAPMKNERGPDEGPPAGTAQRDDMRDRAVYPFFPVGDAPETEGFRADADGFVEVVRAPTGFMAIKRHVFTRMMTHYPDLNYTPDGAPLHSNDGLHWLFFDCMRDPESGAYLSEDYAFCRRWRDMGGTIHADLHAELQHHGQRVYTGDLTGRLRAERRL